MIDWRRWQAAALATCFVCTALYLATPVASAMDTDSMGDSDYVDGSVDDVDDTENPDNPDYSVDVDDSASGVTVDGAMDDGRNIYIDMSVSPPAVTVNLMSGSSGSSTAEEAGDGSGDMDAGSGDRYIVARHVEPGPAFGDTAQSELNIVGTVRGALTAVVGEYAPLTQMVTDVYNDGSVVISNQVVEGLAGMDWIWIVSAGIFALMIYCLFRLLGALISRF